MQHIAQKGLSKYIHSRRFLVVSYGNFLWQAVGMRLSLIADRLLAENARPTTGSQDVGNTYREVLQRSYTQSFRWFGQGTHQEGSKVA